MTLDTDKIRAQLTRSKAVFSCRRPDTEAQNGLRRSLCGGKRPADSRTPSCRPKCGGEYDATREDRRDGAFPAHRRAKQIEEDAKVELQKLLRKSMETIGAVRRQLMPPRENWSATCWHGNQQELPRVGPARAVKCSVKLTRSKRVARQIGRRGAPSRAGHAKAKRTREGSENSAPGKRRNKPWHTTRLETEQASRKWRRSCVRARH